MTADSPRGVLGREEGEAVQMEGLGVRYMLREHDTGGGFALVEHPIAPRALAALATQLAAA